VGRRSRGSPEPQTKGREAKVAAAVGLDTGSGNEDRALRQAGSKRKATRGSVGKRLRGVFRLRVQPRYNGD
jgi:hypothetical protein